MNEQEQKAAEDAIREGEDQYWTLWKEGKINELIDLFHDNFLGWPSSRVEPINKGDIAEFMQNAGKLIGYTIGSFYSNVISPTSGMVYYYWARVQSLTVNKQEVEIPFAGRTSHIWIKEKGKWTIIGGMGGPAISD